MPSWLRRGLLVLCLCLGAASPGLANSTAPSFTVSGRVLDAMSRIPVAGASVDAAGRSAVTDEEGRFRLELPPAAVALHVVAPGYFEESVQVASPEGAAFPALEILLVARSSIREQVEVVAPSPATVPDGPAELPLRPLDVMAVAGGADNVFRTLQTLPGVAATEEFGSRLSVRGGGPDQNLTVMDGVEIHNPYRLFGLTSAFNPETVEGFELDRPAPSAPATATGCRRSWWSRTGRGRPTERLRGSRALSSTDANVVVEGRLPGDGTAPGSSPARRTYYDLVANRITGHGPARVRGPAGQSPDRGRAGPAAARPGASEPRVRRRRHRGRSRGRPG